LIGTPLRRRNGKIGKADRICQCTFMRICQKSQKRLAAFLLPMKF